MLCLVNLLARLALLRWPARVIGNRRLAAAAYMIRYYLIGGRPSENPKALWRMYLNNIRRSDDDTELHNHPWSWAVAIPLVNGYWEERLTPDGVVRRRVLPWRPWAPWRVNYISGRTFHRIELTAAAGPGGPSRPSWSLFIVPGQSVQEWGFLDRATLRFRPAKPPPEAKP